MIAALLFAILPQAEPVVTRCDTIEKNAVFDGCGKRVLTQWIFFAGDDVVAWRLATDELILRDWKRGGFILRWSDGAVFREVRAKCYRVSFTQFDVEIDQRETLPQEKRRGLLTP